jgi:arylsulfatase
VTLTRRDLLRVVAEGATLGGLAIGRVESEPAAPILASKWPPDARGSVAPTSNRPDIVLVVLDDVGYADFGCFGSEIATPAIDRIAAEGLAYTNFHVTALCTPTRAALLTGRNAHRVGAGTISEWARPGRGYGGFVRPEAAMLPEYVRLAGFATAAIGKWHLAPLAHANASGPFEHWPTGRGFDKWYGFHGPVADHWYPELWEGTTAAERSASPDYHLSVDLTDRAIAYLHDHAATAPERPIFLYAAYGACHWPLHVPLEHARRQRGRYDAGWDHVRGQRHRRQLEQGILPPGCPLADRNPGVPAWSTLSADERRFAARGQELYAAFLEHTDLQIGRLYEALRSLGRLQNTLFIVLSDNGASREGGRVGAADLRRNHYVAPERLSDLMAALAALGDASTFPAYAQGWAQASNTPLKWFKSNTFAGGTRAPLLVRWPAGGVPGSERRRQYHHVCDLLPTILEAIGLEPPAVIGGNPQLPIQGISMLYSIRDPAAVTRKSVQVFETQGDRAIWARGWKAVTRHEPSTPFDADVWELYHADEDFAEIRDLASAEPARLAALQALWEAEATANEVLPLDDRTVPHFAANVRPQRPEYVFFPGMARLDRLSSPDISRYPAQFIAHLECDAPASGVLIAFGTVLAGYEITMHDGTLRFDYAFSRSERSTIRASRALPSGRHVVRVGFVPRGTKPADGAVVELSLNDERVGGGVVPRLWPLYTAAAGLRCGLNSGAPISESYRAPFRFDCILERVIVRLSLA